MELAPALARYAHALGRYQAAWRFASPELRRAVALAQISTAWDVFRRDAGVGDVGPAHEISPAAAGLLITEDPRRDGVLLWLADQGASAIADAAAILVRAAGASRRYCEGQQALLDVAGGALADEALKRGPIARQLLAGYGVDDPVFEGLDIVASTVDQLRGDPAFLEGSGDHTHHVLPGGTLSHFVPAEPGGAWALNLALLSRSAALAGVLPCPGPVSRQLFRELEAEEIAVALAEGAAAALEVSYRLFERIEPELNRGREALSAKSRNSRARDVWTLVVAVGAISRAQLTRALELSRAGADIQAHVLADAGLVTLRAAGRIEWARRQGAETMPIPAADANEPTGSFAEFDASMAEVERLLARTTSPR